MSGTEDGFVFNLARYETHVPICRFIRMSTRFLSTYTSSLLLMPGSDSIVDDIERQLCIATNALSTISPIRWQCPYPEVRLCLGNAQNLMSTLSGARHALSGEERWKNWNERAQSMALVGDLWILNYELQEILRSCGLPTPPNLLLFADRPTAISPPAVRFRPRSPARHPGSQPASTSDDDRTRNDLVSERVAIRNLQENAQRSSEYIRRLERELEVSKRSTLSVNREAVASSSNSESGNHAQPAQNTLDLALSDPH